MKKLKIKSQIKTLTKAKKKKDWASNIKEEKNDGVKLKNKKLSQI